MENKEHHSQDTTLVLFLTQYGIQDLRNSKGRRLILENSSSLSNLGETQRIGARALL